MEGAVDSPRRAHLLETYYYNEKSGVTQYDKPDNL